MNFVLYICGGPHDGKVLMKTTSLPAAVIAAETVLEKLEDDAAIVINFEECICGNCYWHNRCRFEQELGLCGHCSKWESREEE